MQRFRLMKVYAASVLLVLVAAITGMAWVGQPQGATPAETDPPRDSATAVRPPNDGGPARPDAAKFPVADGIRDSRE